MHGWKLFVPKVLRIGDDKMNCKWCNEDHIKGKILHFPGMDGKPDLFIHLGCVPEIVTRLIELVK